MKTLDKELKNLKKVTQYTQKDLDKSSVSDAILNEYEAHLAKEEVSRREINKEKKQFLKEEMARIHALKREFGTTKLWAPQVKKTSKDKDALCIMLSDWHVGKVVHDMKGVKIYDTKKALELVHLYATKVLDYVSSHDLADKFDEVIVLLLGDLIDNEIIYDTQVHGIEMPVAEQKHHAVRGLVDFVATLDQGLTKLTGKPVRIRIEGIRGNHGRVHKGQLEASSWEVVIYDTLDLYFGALGKKHITVDYSWEDSYIVEVKGKRGLLRHKAPPHAESAGAKARLGGWNELWNWDFLVHGHFHHWGINTWNSRPVFRNGSFVGPDDLANELGVRDFRSQLIFGVGKEHTPTFMHRVVLE